MSKYPKSKLTWLGSIDICAILRGTIHSLRRGSQRRRLKCQYGLVIVSTIWLLLACLIGGQSATVIPPERPADFEVQTATPTIDPKLVTPTIETTEAAVILPLVDAPTHTPNPDAPPPPTNTLVVVEETVEITPTVALTQELATQEATITAPTRPPVTPDPPIQGGDWDFEADFIPWPNPYGEPCPGASVANGWTAFVEKGPYGSSCMNENLYAPNVFSGFKSQEITFDFISANSGILRPVATKPGHQYSIKAFAKHDRSLSPVEMTLGVDLTGARPGMRKLFNGSPGIAALKTLGWRRKKPSPPPESK